MPTPPSSLAPAIQRIWMAAGAAVLAGPLAACQVYDFEPVTPLALGQTTQVTTLQVTPFKPNLLLLVDKSGSMDLPVDQTDLACRTAPGGEVCGQVKAYACNVASCPTRWSTLTSTLDQFIQDNYAAARYGLTFFPAPPADDVAQQCTPTLSVAAPIPPTADDSDASLQAMASAARAALASVQSANPMGPTGTGGGTPTGDSLKYFNSHPEAVVDPTRDAYVVLLTDGLPNCDSQLASAVGTPACVCTLQSNQDCIDARPLGIGCLDAQATVDVIGELKSAQQITTVVLGFGADTAVPGATQTLQAMAIAGGFTPRACPNKKDPCGPTNPCDLGSGLCSKQYYEATDGDSLRAALDAIYAGIGPKACVVPLPEVPATVELISVVVDGTPVLHGPDTWEYRPAGYPDWNPPSLRPNPDGPSIQFLGALCTTIQGSSKKDPVRLEIRLVTPL
ncbi:MAG TPA: adventurous gliding motility lipoprotein CglB [Myxococcaceae bacterium]|nr:adventurous gliding motility lipoprotein CglB [Myxococcaceae bacterium]